MSTDLLVKKYRGLLIPSEKTDLLGRCFELTILGGAAGLVLFLTWALMR